MIDFKKTSLGLLLFTCLHLQVTGQVKQDSVTAIPSFSISYPNWSPDGTRVAFQSDMFDENDEIYVMNIDGTGLKRLTHNSRTDETPVWSPDGTQIMFASFPEGGKHDIYIMNADGTGTRNVTGTPGFREDHPKFSPDGTRVIFNSDRDSDPDLPDGEYDYEIYEMALDGSGLQRLTDHGEWDTYPEISPDGSRFLWRRVIVESGQRNSEIFVSERDGSNPTNLTNHSGFDGYPTWSPDGTKILFASVREVPGNRPRPAIYVMNADGTGLSRVTNPTDEEVDVRPWWSRDGTKIVFNRLRNGVSRFMIAHLSDISHPIFLHSVRSGELVSDDGSSRGVAWADYDKNGFPDLVVANTMNNSNFVYRNNGDGSFLQVGEDPISFSGMWSEGVSWVDVDNDRDLDLFVANQWDGPNQLFMNGGEHGFTAAEKTGDLTSSPSNSPASCWADYNLDGFMDVYVITRDGGDDSLFKNNGDGTFSRIEEGNISSNGGDGRSCAWGDFDGDRYPELYVGNFINREGEDVSKARNYFYKNNGDGTFTEITAGPHVNDRNVSYGVSVVDYDYDDDLDIFVTNIASTDANVLYQNNGNGQFRRASLVITEERNRPSKGHAWGDVNNDGYIDLFVANGTENIALSKIRNQLYLGDRNHNFIEIQEAPIVEKERTSAGTAWADYDRDGDLDLFIANWGGNNEDNEFYYNNITENAEKNWFAMVLEGIDSNTFGIGTKVRLKATISGNSYWQTRTLWPQTGYSSQNESIIHMGLGDAEEVEMIEIHWPSGNVDRYEHLKPNRYYRAKENNSIDIQSRMREQ